jgi:predicted metal-dependent enzyme (double-stranded beta helix superfamily)
MLRRLERAAMTITAFIADCTAIAERLADPADRVVAIAPLMERLLSQAGSFLTSAHRRPDPMHYARHPLHVASDGSLSLFALVWQPGQWTPVHDHGSWGVVGVVEGVLEERNFMSVDGEIRSDEGIRLKRGGAILLGAGSVTSFVPNPDHIHMTGVPETRRPVVSLHLYGRNMDSFHVYDVAHGTRKLVQLPQES